MITALKHTFTEIMKRALEEARQFDKPVILSQVKSLNDSMNPSIFMRLASGFFRRAVLLGNSWFTLYDYRLGKRMYSRE
ncbi:hypothetical protein MGI18_22875 [Bacillus sp. OVS6]|nr:hypothetical protein MGI18_22875 [Bacillus sp. OVS6]